MNDTLEQMPISKKMAAQGYSLERYVSRYAYPRNGNVHNPTPSYVWILKKDGIVIGQGYTRRAALSLADF